MNANELRPLLVEYRAQVEKAWTPETAHGGYDAKSGSPAGQCVATSLWLQKRLWLDHGVSTTFTLGSLFAEPNVELRQHCWLETRDQLILDLTADQLEPGQTVVCTYWPCTVVEHGIRYSVGMFMYDLSDQPDLLKRADLLSEAVNA